MPIANIEVKGSRTNHWGKAATTGGFRLEIESGFVGAHFNEGAAWMWIAIDDPLHGAVDHQTCFRSSLFHKGEV
jgi:hypothetical protein